VVVAERPEEVRGDTQAVSATSSTTMAASRRTAGAIGQAAAYPLTRMAAIPDDERPGQAAEQAHLGPADGVHPGRRTP
jgi:hypothetical protein